MTAASDPPTVAIDRTLRRVGINARCFRALLHAYLLMDFRNQHFARSTATGSKALITPLFWVVGQNLLISGIVCVVLFARVDAFFFVFVNLGVSMLVMATSIIVEFNEVVLDPGDLDVIGHHPLPVRTYAAARVTNLLGYVLLVIVSMSVFPTIMVCGLADGGWWQMPGYAVAALTGNLLVAGVLILFYTLLLNGRPGDAAREILAWTQIVLIMLLFYGGQLVFRDPADRLEMMAYYLPQWVVYLPPGWLAYFVTNCAAADVAASWWILAASVLAAAVTWLAVTGSLSVAYAKMQPGGGAWRRVALPGLPQPGQLAGWYTRLVTRPWEERTAFWLCSTMLRRDHNLRMRSWPSLGIVLAALALGLFSGQLDDPLAASGPKCVMSLALYDDWITRADPLPAATPRALVAACPALYIARAERTLVCGNAEQRRRALKFIEWAGSPEAIAVLHRARLWAAKRKQTALTAAIVQTIHQLEGPGRNRHVDFVPMPKL